MLVYLIARHKNKLSSISCSEDLSSRLRFFILAIPLSNIRKCVAGSKETVVGSKECLFAAYYLLHTAYSRLSIAYFYISIAVRREQRLNVVS